jgi:predicted acetyltransferase
MDLSLSTEEKRISLYSPFKDFKFESTDDLFYEEVSLLCVDINPKHSEFGSPVPRYEFDMTVDNQVVGAIDLRVGYDISYYVVGQIGYGVEEDFRGNGYAVKACYALLPLLKKHGFGRILLTIDENNIASKRSCEKIGALFIETIDTPEWSVLYEEGQRRTSIFEWILE